MTSFRTIRLALLGGLLLCTTAGFAQSTVSSPNNGPWRTISQAGDGKLMLEGHDAVAYFTQNEAVKGDPSIRLEYRGVTWRFASEANRASFEKSPEQYMPQFGGYCANGINYAIPGGGGGGPNSWRIYRGKLYVFGGQAARDHFEMETEKNIELAHKYWNESLAGGDARELRAKFMRERVSHYKTDRALNEEYAAKLAAKTLPVMPGMPQVVPAR
ncbi:MAG: YHS domain-containing (seleno)protein [Burkholderiales bacterium]